MLRLPLAGARLGSQGFYTHDEHQATSTISSQGCIWSREVVSQRTAPHPGLLHVEFIYSAHQFQITGTKTRSRTTVITGTRQPHKLTAAFNRNLRMTGIDHLLFLRPAKFSPGRCDKKSFSTLSLPIRR